MSKHFATGSEPKSPDAGAPRFGAVVLVQLITTAALALSTLIAATAVSIGFARADVPGAVAGTDVAPFALACLIGLLLAGMGGLTVLATEERKSPR